MNGETEEKEEGRRKMDGSERRMETSVSFVEV